MKTITKNLIIVISCVYLLMSCTKNKKEAKSKISNKNDFKVNINKENLNELVGIYKLSKTENKRTSTFTASEKAKISSNEKSNQSVKAKTIIKSTSFNTQPNEPYPFNISTKNYQILHLHCCDNEEFTIFTSVNGNYNETNKNYNLESISFKLENYSDNKMYLKKGGIKPLGNTVRNIPEGTFDFFEFKIELTNNKEESEDIITLNTKINKEITFNNSQFIDAHLMFNGEEYKDSNDCKALCRNRYIDEFFNKNKVLFKTIETIKYFENLDSTNINNEDIVNIKKDNNYVIYAQSANLNTDLEKIKFGKYLYDINKQYNNNDIEKIDIFSKPFWYNVKICRRRLVLN